MPRIQPQPLVAVVLLGLTLAFALATTSEARADGTFSIDGRTPEGKTYRGSVYVSGGLAVASVRLEGVGPLTLETAVPAGRTAEVFRIEEVPDTDGVRSALATIFEERRSRAKDGFVLIATLDVPGTRTTSDPRRPKAMAAAPKRAGWTVEILGADGAPVPAGDAAPILLVGQKATFRARVRDRQGREVEDGVRFQWRVDGSHIHDYSLDVVRGPSLPEGERGVAKGRDMHANQLELSVTKMAPAHLRAAELSLYWTDEAQGRRVAVRALTPEGGVDAEAIVHVRRTETPARELFTVPEHLAANWRVIDDHKAWHRGWDRADDRFFYFHRALIRAYDHWRSVFGYLPVEAVEDLDEPGSGVAVPRELTAGGGLERFPSLDALSRASQRFHADGHGAEMRRLIDGRRVNAEMAGLSSPRCEVFYMWHEKVDRVAREWEALKAAGTLEND